MSSFSRSFRPTVECLEGRALPSGAPTSLVVTFQGDRLDAPVFEAGAEAPSTTDTNYFDGRFLSGDDLTRKQSVDSGGLDVGGDDILLSGPGDDTASSTNDTNGHGTHVAGTIGAVGDNGVAILSTSSSGQQTSSEWLYVPVRRYAVLTQQTTHDGALTGGETETDASVRPSSDIRLKGKHVLEN